jgi:4-amino-4-deoxy-L-arabinose transferase-like glycosyltransferase
VVAAPWHHAMIIRHGMAFWNELFGDNHWRRMVLGRHGDRGSFEYFLREMGYAILPWVAVAPAALAWAVLREVPAPPPPSVPELEGSAVREAAAAEARRQGIIRLGAIWFVAAYALVSLSMTKFHHYVLPAVPGLAIVIGCFLDDIVARRTSRRAAAVALVGVPFLVLITVDLVDTKNAAQRFLWLFSYDYVHNVHGRPWPESLDFRGPLIAFVTVFALATIGLAVRRVRRAALISLCVAAVLFTFYLLDVYMRAVAPFWSQKEPIATYYEKRRSPEERLIAYQMYWRGETFYTKNEIYEGPMEERTVFDQETADEKLKEWITHHRGHRQFFLYERGQQSHLQGMLPPESRASFEVLDSRNNKFSLAKADL